MKEKQYQTNIKNLQEEIEEKDRIIKELQNNLQIRDDEIRANDLKIDLLENNERELRRELRENAVRWDAKEKELNNLIKNQIQDMERNRKKQIDELNGIHTNKTNTMKHQLNEKQR